jgi:hypothetical protein
MHGRLTAVVKKVAKIQIRKLPIFHGLFPNPVYSPGWRDVRILSNTHRWLQFIRHPRAGAIPWATAGGDSARNIARSLRGGTTLADPAPRDTSASPLAARNIAIRLEESDGSLLTE